MRVAGFVVGTVGVVVAAIALFFVVVAMAETTGILLADGIQTGRHACQEIALPPRLGQRIAIVLVSTTPEEVRRLPWGTTFAVLERTLVPPGSCRPAVSPWR